MRQVIKATGSSLQVINVNESALELDFIKKNIGDCSGTGYIEGVFKEFQSMPEIAIVCDGEGKLKGYPVSLSFPIDTLVGDALIVQIEQNAEKEEDFYGISAGKVQLVLASLIIQGMWFPAMTGVNNG
jgi:hypothetical protein